MKNKFRMNPILKKELMVNARTMKMSWAIFVINGILSMTAVCIMVFIYLMNGYEINGISYLSSLFPVLVAIECLLITIIIPIITASSISGEVERKTLDIMLTTPISSFSIVIGKLSVALVITLMYIITSLPILSIPFAMGGMPLWTLIVVFLLEIYIGIFVGSIGVFSSTVSKSSVVATILSITIIGFFLIVPIVVFAMISSITTYMTISNNYFLDFEYLKYILYFIPYAPIVDFMIDVLTDVNLNEVFLGKSSDTSLVLKIIDKVDIVISIAFHLIVSYIFILLASKNIKRKSI